MDRILEYWDNQGKVYKSDHTASWGDINAINLEIETIGKYIRGGDDVLDVGCANGFSTFKHLDKNISTIVGVDFSPSMIVAANLAKKDYPEYSKQIEFKEGDIRNLDFDDETFDVVYTTRVLINLPTWEEQKLGIKECLRVCDSGGTVIFSEGFWEPLVLLNSMRLLVGLDPLVEHDFNRYIKKSRLEEFLKEQNLSFECVDFSSIYYLGSRFLREILTDKVALDGFSNSFNNLFYDIETKYSGGGFGIQQAYVIKKCGKGV
jgi:ubiquinone/menaquinone biosynthesis C-methylase UbiE